MGNGTAVDVEDVQQGSVAITNNGQITAASLAQASTLTGVFVADSYAQGAITLTNTGTIATAGTANSAYGANLGTSGSGGITVMNSGTMSASAPGGEGNVAAGLSVFSSGSGAIVVNNSNTITGSGYVFAYATGINANASGTGAISITNSGTVSGTNTASGYTATGIQANADTGPVMIQSGGNVSANASGAAESIVVTTNGAVTVQTTGQTSATSSGSAATGILVSGQAGLVTATNGGTMTISGAYGASTSGIYVLNTTGAISITNSGDVTVTSGGLQYGALYGKTGGTADVTINNSGILITSTSSGYARGLSSDTSTGTGESIINNMAGGTITATSSDTSRYAAGIFVDANNGGVAVTNAGTTSGLDPGGAGYGILIIGNNSEVTNTGTAIGTTSGIFLASPGTVNNYGLASGGTYAIQVPTASTVNLDGASPVQGLLKGGPDASSTSALNFNIAIRGDFNAQKTSLDAAIATYGAAYATAGGVGNVDSSIVVLNGIDYRWEDFLDITDNLVQARLYAATPGFQGIGAAIDNFDTTNPRGAGIQAALDNLPDSAVANALAQLSPKALQVFRNIAFDGADFTAANVNNHLANLRDGLTGFDTSGFSVNAPGVDPMLTQMKSHLLAFNAAPSDGLLSDSSPSLFGAFDPKDAKDTKALVNTEPVDRWSAFISGSVILANLDNTTSNIGDSDYTTGSVLAGVDYRLTEHFTVGALFDYAHTSANLDGNGSKATVDSYSPGVYASYVDKGWYGNALLMYGFNNNTDDRQVTIPGIAGDNHGASDGGQITSGFTGGYEFQRGPFKFGPVVSLQYVHLTVGSFQEQGPTSLSIDRQEADSLRSQVGFEARYSTQTPTPVGLMTFTPHFQASWQHEYMDNSDGISSQFNGGAGGGSFIVQGQQPERDSAFLDIGLDAEVAKNVTLFIDYQTQAGQDNFFAQSAQGGVRIGF
jgi:fibronectin-binding autotransporter adhesin